MLIFSLYPGYFNFSFNHVKMSDYVSESWTLSFWEGAAVLCCECYFYHHLNFMVHSFILIDFLDAIIVPDDAPVNDKIPLLGDGGDAADKTAALTVDTSQPPNTQSSAPALSIQFNPKSSKFNLKIGSPVMKGNIFQKYKARTEAPSFNKHADQADRKYRKNTGKEGDAVQVDDDDEDEDDDDENDPKTKEQLLKMLGIEAPAPVVVKKEEVWRINEYIYTY